MDTSDRVSVQERRSYARGLGKAGCFALIAKGAALWVRMETRTMLSSDQGKIGLFVLWTLGSFIAIAGGIQDFALDRGTLFQNSVLAALAPLWWAGVWLTKIWILSAMSWCCYLGFKWGFLGLRGARMAWIGSHAPRFLDAAIGAASEWIDQCLAAVFWLEGSMSVHDQKVLGQCVSAPKMGKGSNKRL